MDFSCHVKVTGSKTVLLLYALVCLIFKVCFAFYLRCVICFHRVVLQFLTAINL